MRFHKIRLQNYRGVEDSEVSFAPQGVTVIQGPNEVGKTSIAEAISLILDELDSSSKQKARDVKPVNKDVGAEVELEFTTGPYHLRYAKRWNSRAMTTLEILAPTHENLTGRPAHERVRQILEETTDEALWRALRYEQGVAITQATLNESRSLAAALDAATSGTGVTANGIEADLLEAVLTERSKYLTLTGRPTVDRTNLASEVTGLDGEVHALKEQLDAVEAATEQLPASAAGLRGHPRWRAPARVSGHYRDHHHQWRKLSQRVDRGSRRHLGQFIGRGALSNQCRRSGGQSKGPWQDPCCVRIATQRHARRDLLRWNPVVLCSRRRRQRSPGWRRVPVDVDPMAG